MGATTPLKVPTCDTLPISRAVKCQWAQAAHRGRGTGRPQPSQGGTGHGSGLVGQGERQCTHHLTDDAMLAVPAGAGWADDLKCRVVDRLAHGTAALGARHRSGRRWGLHLFSAASYSHGNRNDVR
jgi:hypothetical protein